MPVPGAYARALARGPGAAATPSRTPTCWVVNSHLGAEGASECPCLVHMPGPWPEALVQLLPLLVHLHAGLSTRIWERRGLANARAWCICQGPGQRPWCSCYLFSYTYMLGCQLASGSGGG